MMKIRGRKLLLCLTHRYCILAANSLIAVITTLIISDMLNMISDTVDNTQDLENMSDGLGTIFIGYGVVIEERGTLMDFFGLYPEHFNQRQDAVDHLCHWYGLMYLILGLFMEIGVQIIKIPNRLINTMGMEGPIFGVNIVFMLLALLLLVRHSLVLHNPQRHHPAKSGFEATPSAHTPHATNEE
ncbi:MAG: hypothetical protein GX443_13540 [Deltaproteobacteria bacterium]|nr:hypothetical protein [Deltaproteobacteria bacterium]